MSKWRISERPSFIAVPIDQKRYDAVLDGIVEAVYEYWASSSRKSLGQSTGSNQPSDASRTKGRTYNGSI